MYNNISVLFSHFGKLYTVGYSYDTFSPQRNKMINTEYCSGDPTTFIHMTKSIQVLILLKVLLLPMLLVSLLIHTVFCWNFAKKLDLNGLMKN